MEPVSGRRSQEDAFALRWFTPVAEVDLRGPAALASARFESDVRVSASCCKGRR